MKYAVEPLAEVFEEIEQLSALHYAETAHTLADLLGPLPLELDAVSYRTLALAGLLRIFTARDGTALAGYATYIVAGSNLHHRGLKYAANDALFVLPEYRGVTGTRLIRHAEHALAAEGVCLVTLTAPTTTDWSRLAEHWGYTRCEAQFQKWIGGPRHLGDYRG